MSNITHTLLQNIQKRYLSPDGADVWFCFDNERIPGHKIILTSSPWLDSMFYGSLPEGDEVDMSNSGVTSRSFKEFLRYIYLGGANLTMENIKDVIHLAKLSLCEELFVECEKFLMDKMTIDNIFFIYELALLYEANQLKTKCEEEICVNAENIFRSSSFLQVEFDFLENILQVDSLVCEEKVIFDACIEWAKAACRRKRIDQYNPLNVRAQLNDSLYQIRFSSMTVGDAASCLQSCPDLFTVDELQEIMCMIGRKNYSRQIRFNWTPRYFSLRYSPSHSLTCKRYSKLQPNDFYTLRGTENTTFTCNRKILLTGFTCECNQCANKYASVMIVEKKDEENVNVRCDERKNIMFHQEINRNRITYDRRLGFHTSSHKSYEANVRLNRAILIKPDYRYTLTITFDNAPNNLRHFCKLKNKVRIDHDIVLRFDESRQMFTSFTLSRLNKRNYFRKIVYNPRIWFELILLLLVIAYLIRYEINRPDSILLHLWEKLKGLFG